MRISVVGGAGFIGSNFARYWLQRHPDDRVDVLDALTYAGNLDNLADLAADHADRYSFRQVDIRDFEATLGALEDTRPDAVVNFAAESHNSRAVLEPGIFFETNVVGTQRLLEATRRAGVERFHHISTCEVFGDLPLDSDEVFTEESPYRPRTPYNASKAGADMAVRAYVESFGLHATITNCANNFGPYQFPEKVIPHFTILGISGEKLTLYRNSANRREWLHVDDHCAAIELVLRDGRGGEMYNVGSGEERDVEEIADLVLDELGLDEDAKTYVPDRPGHDRRYLLSHDKIAAELEWTPTHPVDTGIRDTIRWYVDNPGWWEPLLDRRLDESAWAEAGS